MKRSRHSWWLIYGACVVALLVTLSWITSTVLRLERQERQARAETQNQQVISSALTRMDAWLLPLLAMESGRPYFEYLPYYPAGRSYTRILNEIQKGEILQPSPLLAVKPEFIRLHFQIDGSGEFTSPQIPEGNLRDLAEATCLAVDSVPRHIVWRELARKMVQSREVLDRVVEVENREAVVLAEMPAPLPELVVKEDDGDQRWTQRARTAYEIKRNAQIDAQNMVNTLEGAIPQGPLEGVSVSPVVPLWLGGDENELFLFRRATVNGEELLQGVFLDWPLLRTALLAEAAPLAEGATLEPVVTKVPVPRMDSLASIPARLDLPAIGVVGGPTLSTSRVTLTVTWLAVVLSMIAVGWTLRQSVEFGERRNRFASAVTHELRTPLTTFQMYSEMLADGMVGKERRQEYLQTLKTESRRLATLVENVLSYARLEDGRNPVRHERVNLSDLLQRVTPNLERRVVDADMQWQMRNQAETAVVDVDVDAVGQILFNLVDNSCKYARSNRQPGIELNVESVNGWVDLEVRDHGPGIPSAEARRIFDPFERAHRNDDQAPGIGLGLALSRELAHEFGGDLTLVDEYANGAAFRLRLPVAAH